LRELRLANKDSIIATLNELGIQQYRMDFNVERGVKYEFIVAEGFVGDVHVHIMCEPESLRKSYCIVECPTFALQGAKRVADPKLLKSAILEVVAIAKQLKQRHSELVALTEMLKENGFEIAAFANHVEAFKSYGGASYIRIYMDASSRVSIVLQVLDVAPQQAVELAKKLDKAITEALSITTK
jgi:hypothetical protein